MKISKAISGGRFTRFKGQLRCGDLLGKAIIVVPCQNNAEAAEMADVITGVEDVPPHSYPVEYIHTLNGALAMPIADAYSLWVCIDGCDIGIAAKTRKDTSGHDLSGSLNKLSGWYTGILSDDGGNMFKFSTDNERFVMYVSDEAYKYEEDAIEAGFLVDVL